MTVLNLLLTCLERAAALCATLDVCSVRTKQMQSLLRSINAVCNRACHACKLFSESLHAL